MIHGLGAVLLLLTVTVQPQADQRKPLTPDAPKNAGSLPRFGTCLREGSKLVGTRPVRVGRRIPVPEKIRNVWPKHPELPPKTAASGGMWAGEVLIGKDGRVVRVWVIREPQFTPPFPPFSEAIVAAVRQWEFAPLIVEKIATPLCMTVTMNIHWE